MFVLLHKNGRAAHSERAAVEHMGIDHGGFHVLVAQQLLNGADVLARLRLRLASPPSAPRSDRDDGGPGFRNPCRAIASAGGTPTATPTPDWRLGTSGPGHRASAHGPSQPPGRRDAGCEPSANAPAVLASDSWAAR